MKYQSCHLFWKSFLAVLLVWGAFCFIAFVWRTTFHPEPPFLFKAHCDLTIAILEGHAQKEAAAASAQSAILRAQGIARANRILSDPQEVPPTFDICFHYPPEPLYHAD